MIYAVEQIRPIATPMARSYGVKSLSLFYGDYIMRNALPCPSSRLANWRPTSVTTS